MSFLTTLSQILKVAGAAAPAVAAAISPAAGAVVSLIVNAVSTAEQAGGTGAQKKVQVMQQVLPAIGPALNAVLQARGVTVAVDPSQMSSAVGTLVDGIVGLMNAFGAAPTQASTSAGTAAS